MISDGVLGKLPLDGTITITSAEYGMLHRIGGGDVIHGLMDYLNNQEKSSGKLLTSIDDYALRYVWEPEEANKSEPEHVDVRRLEEDNVRDILASLAAGTKLPEGELAWFLQYNEEKLDVYNEQRFWRNRKHDTVYRLIGCTLRVSDSIRENVPSPLVVSVNYTPSIDPYPSGRCVIFNRDLVSFLQKFEPVVKDVVYTGSSIPLFPVHGTTF